MTRSMIIFVVVVFEICLGLGLGAVLGFSWDMTRMTLWRETTRNESSERYESSVFGGNLSLREVGSGVGAEGLYTNSVYIEPDWDWPAFFQYTAHESGHAPLLIEVKFGTPDEVGRAMADDWWLSYRQEAESPTGPFSRVVYSIRPHGRPKIQLDYIDSNLDGMFNSVVAIDRDTGERSEREFVFGEE